MFPVYINQSVGSITEILLRIVIISLLNVQNLWTFPLSPVRRRMVKVRRGRLILMSLNRR